MTKKGMVIGLIIATLLGLITNIIASQLEPLFSGQSVILFIIFIVLLFFTIKYSAEDRNSSLKQDKAKNIEKVADAEQSETVTDVKMFQIIGEDVLINERNCKFKKIGNRYLPPPINFGKGGRLFGRAGLFEEAMQILISEHPEPIVFHGLGGIGKSALASSLAWGLSDLFFGNVIWVDKGLNDVSNLCDEIGILISQDSISSLTVNEKIRRIRFLLSQQPTLVILDGCENRDVVQLFSEQCSPAGLIITSREKIALVGRLIEVKSLQKESAINLLSRFLDLSKDSVNDVEKIFKLLDGHPQAITIAGALCLEEHLTLSELIQLLINVDTRALKLRLGEGVKNSVIASFEASYKKLILEERRVFQLLGGSWSTTITGELLEYITSNNKLLDSEQLLRGLVKHAFITYEEGLYNIKIYRVHDLILSYAHALVCTSKNGIQKIRNYWITGCIQYAQHYSKMESDGFNWLEVEIENLICAAEWAIENKLWDEVNNLTLAIYKSDLRWGTTMIDMRGYTQRCIKCLQGGLLASQKIGKQHDEAIHLLNLSVANYTLGNYSISKELASQALDIGISINDQHIAGVGYLYLAYCESTATHYDNSQKYLEKALDVARKNDDKWLENDVLGNMARDNFYLGNYKIAIETYQLALHIAIEIGDKLYEGKHLSRLADCYQKIGEYEIAIKLYERAIKIARETNNKMGEQFDLGGLGMVTADLGQFTNAIEYLEQALQIAITIGFSDGEMYRLVELASVYARSDQPQKGMKFASEALDKSLRIGNKFFESYARLSIAECTIGINDLDNAEKELLYTFDIANAGQFKNVSAEALHLLGIIAINRSDLTAAKRVLNQELDLRREMQQTKKINEITSMINKIDFSASKVV